jgi:nucleoside-diphosphate-sugar epimerase
MKVLVTGGSGIVGHYVIDELIRTGYEVVNADKVRWGNLGHSGTGGAAQSTALEMRGSWPKLPTFFEVDVTNYGQVVSAMDGCKAVVHLAACPSASYYTEEFVFFTNTTSMWNVMRAAEQLKVQKVILGSSYNAVGAMGTAARWAPREVKPPEYFPLDDQVGTRSEDPYSIAKWLGEQTADAFARRNPDVQYSSMRFNGMWDDNRFRELHRKPITDPWTRCQGFWTYLHIKDAATACRMAIESAGWSGHEKFFLNADDTMITVPTMDAIRLVYPKVPLRREFEGFEAPISTERAWLRLGWRPKYSWRDPQFA